MTRSDAVTPAARAQAAAAAGASSCSSSTTASAALSEYVGASPIPVASVHRDAGAELIALAKTGGLTLSVKQTPYTGYVYDLTRNYPGQVPDQSLVYKPSHADLARIDARYHAVTDGEGARLPLRPDVHPVARGSRSGSGTRAVASSG